MAGTKTGTKRTSRAAKRQQAADEGRKKKEIYLKMKKEVLKAEEENFKSLYVFKTPDGWYKMVKNSAVIYVFDLAKRLKINPKMIVDTDYDAVAPEGVVTFQNLETFEKRLGTLKIFRRYSSEWLIIFDLETKYTPERLAELRHEDEMKTQRANKLILPEEVFPELKVRIQELGRAIHPNVRKMDPMGRDLVGRELDKIAGEMLEGFVMAMNGWEDVDLFLMRSMKNLARIEAKMLVVMNFGMFKINQIDRILSEVGKVRRKLEDADKKRQKKREAEAKKDVGAEIRKRKKKQEEKDGK